MKRSEFISHWRALRTARVRAQVKAGSMRASEAAMTLASVDTEAARLWRNNRRDYSKFTAEDFASMLARTGAQ